MITVRKYQSQMSRPSWYDFTTAILGLMRKFLVSYHVGRAKMHHRTKFHQNRSNGCGDIAFNVYQNGGVSMQNFVEIGRTVAEI